jgi:hypothetical protein
VTAVRSECDDQHEGNEANPVVDDQRRVRDVLRDILASFKARAASICANWTVSSPAPSRSIQGEILVEELSA